MQLTWFCCLVFVKSWMELLWNLFQMLLMDRMWPIFESFDLDIEVLNMVMLRCTQSGLY